MVWSLRVLGYVLQDYTGSHERGEFANLGGGGGSRNQTIKFWTACAENFEMLEYKRADPCPQIELWVEGELKATIKGANAPAIEKAAKELLEFFVQK